MHVKAAVCCSTAGEGAGLYMDSGCESSVEEQTCRRLVTMSPKVNVSTLVQTEGDRVVEFGKSVYFLC